MKQVACHFYILFTAVLLAAASTRNPYAETNKSYKKQVKAIARTIRTAPLITLGADSLDMGDVWVGTTNFNLRKPNYVVIHHTAQHSTAQTLKTFTVPRTQVSAHYVIGRDGKVYHMLNDYLRAWHAGSGKWGNNTDINSSSIGIELDNNGSEPFAEDQINSLLRVLSVLKKTHGIPAANFIGHSDIAPTRKTDPNATFPWRKLAEKGFGLWYDEEVLENIPVADSMVIPAPLALADSTLSPDSTADINLANVNIPGIYNVPAHFNPAEALRIIGYDISNLDAAIRAFKLHFIQKEVNAVLTELDKRVLYNLYKKYL